MEIDLPYVVGSTTIEKARETLEGSRDGGLVIESSDGPALLTKEELERAFQAHANPNLPVSELSPTRFARQLKLPQNPEEILFSPTAKRGFEAALAGGGPQYSILNIGDRRARIATFSSGLIEILTKGFV